MSATARSAVSNTFEPSSFFFFADNVIFVVAKPLCDACNVTGLTPKRQR